MGQGLEILLQHRAPWSHNGDTWGLPGGALNWSESAVDGAMREAFEEVGIDQSRMIWPIGELVPTSLMSILALLFPEHCE